MFGSTAVPAVSVPAGGRAEPPPAGMSPVIPGVGGGGWSFVGATSMPVSMGVGREAEGQESVRSSPGREESGSRETSMSNAHSGSAHVDVSS